MLWELPDQAAQGLLHFMRVRNPLAPADTVLPDWYPPSNSRSIPDNVRYLGAYEPDGWRRPGLRATGLDFESFSTTEAHVISVRWYSTRRHTGRVVLKVPRDFALRCPPEADPLPVPEPILGAAPSGEFWGRTAPVTYSACSFSRRPAYNLLRIEVDLNPGWWELRLPCTNPFDTPVDEYGDPRSGVLVPV